MPLTETIKQSDNSRKKTTDSINSLSKKRSGRIRESSVENGSRGDDISPPRMGNNKKPLTKKVVSDNNSEKRAKTPIADKVPKKSVQRAKGSLALNKTIEAEEKKKRVFDVEGSNLNSTTTIKDNNEGPKVKVDRCKPKQPVKNLAIEKRVPSAKKKNWATVVKKKSGMALKGDEEEEETQTQAQPQQPPVEVVPRETKSVEMQPEGVPFSSCSFFEKLQQGVKAYFSSRNSLTEEKSKKKVTDGGIRTGAGVAKGDKEETKARIQEKKINNKIKNLDSDLFYDRPRLKSNSGGQTNNFLNQKPKVLQYVRRKKLYHPKKHYVRVQIPRKGYFYRFFEFRPNPSPTCPVNDRVESIPLPTQSEIQIARMASSSPKVSNIHKKRIKKSRKKTSDATERNDEFSLVCGYLEAINFILNQNMVAQKFEKEVNRLALDWPIEAVVTPADVNFLREEKKAVSSKMFYFEENKNLSGDDSLSLNNSATKIENLDCGFQIESAESYSILESQMRNMTSECKTPDGADHNPDPSFDVLMNYLRNSLGDEQRIDDFEISPKMMNKDLEFNSISETPPKLESDEKVAGFKNDDSDKDHPNSLKQNYCVATAFSDYKNGNLLKVKRSDEHFAELLIGDIDLHSELQNYINETKSSKADNAKKISPVVNQNDQPFGLKEKWSERNFDFTPRRDANLLNVPFNPLSEIESPSKETMKFVTLENSGSHVTNNVSDTQWETDCKNRPQENVDCKAGIDEKEKLVSQLVSLLFQKHNEQLEGAQDRYENLSPMRAGFKTKKSKSKLLRSNSENSVPKEQLSKIKNLHSESNQLQKNEDTEAHKKIKTQEDADVKQSRKDRKWCPTFDELTDIYSCILKHNSRAKNSKRLKNLQSFSILPILKDKLQKRQKKMDLINFIKTLKEYFTPPSDWKPGADTDKHKKLQEYVSMFQEILTSSLSIDQITYLNNIMSQMQEQEASTQSCDNKNDQESIKYISDDDTESKNKTPTPPVSPEKIKEQVPKPAKNTSASVQSKTTPKEKSSLKKIRPTESLQKVALSPPAELEKVLKSTFNSESIRKRTKTVDKILVNVKVCGSRVLVNDFSYIHDEKSLYARPPTRNKVSELIIENITSDRSIKASLSELSLSQLTPKKSSKKLVKKSQNIKIVLKSTKPGPQNSEKKLKIKNDDSDKESENLKEGKLKTLKAVEECKIVSPLETVFPSVPKSTFEYNQERLKAQHPIDAIIETSESKIMESTESAENFNPHDKPTAETKSSKRLEVTEVKEGSNKPMAERPFLKDLINDLGWSNDDVRKDLVRTRSHDLNSNRDEKSILTVTSTNDVKFLDDSRLKLGSVGKKNRKVPVRTHNTYFCYPSVVHQDKSKEVKKKSSKEGNLKIVKKTNPKAVKKTEARAVKTANVKVSKETDLKVVKPTTESVKKIESRMIKTSSKPVKKTDSRVIKTVNSKAGKQPDLKVVKTTNTKPVPKKTVKENIKRSDILPKFSSQVAATERLTKKPERLSKSNRISPKQKENDAQSGKAPLNKTPNSNARKNSEHSLLYMKGITDFGSEASSFNASTASCNFEEVLKQKQKPHSGNSAKSTSSSETAEIIDKYKTSPIVIFSTLGDSDGVTSQFAMIHSDSVLKTLSRSPISPTKIESVFKSHSDLKFYPGRISDSMEEQRPWVKFILTPQQEANADLPAHQIKVVDKHRQAKVDSENEAKEDTQIPLNSIEKFIDELRDSRLNVLRQKELQKRKNEKNKISSSAMVKQKIKWSPCDVSKNLALKKQDCQKNKTKISFLEARRRSDKKYSGREVIFAKVIVSILQLLLEQRMKEIGTVEQLEENFESENLPTDSDGDASGEEGVVEKWRKLEKTATEMLATVIDGVAKFEKPIKKNKLVVAIKAELKKREADLGANFSGLMELSKRVDTLKILKRAKFETLENEVEEKAEKQKGSFQRTSEDMKLVDSLLSKENEVGDLGRRPSTYFDAEEKAKGENEGCSNRSQYQSGDTFANVEMLALLGESKTEIKDGEEAYPKINLTPSDENLLSGETISTDTQEIIFSKIHENLEENNVQYSLALLDSLLKKRSISDREEKLQNFLQTVNQKSKNLMKELEKSAWLKLLFLLEEVSRMYNIQAEKSLMGSIYRYITNQLNKPLAFVGSVQKINTKMADLQNFLSQSKVCNDLHLQEVFSRFLTRLTEMKNTVVPRLTCSVMRFLEDEALGNSPGYEIRTVKAAHNFYSPPDDPKKKIHLQFLKNEIRDQRLFIEYLISTDLGSSASEITDVKNRVSEKLRVLEKSLSNMAVEEHVRNTSTESLLESMANSVSLSQISSFLTLTRACRNVGITKQSTWKAEE